jgi:hypothetical protein
MPRKGSQTIVDVTGPEVTPLDSIDKEVKDFVEFVWEKQQKTPARERVEYDTEKEKDAEFKLMSDYVAQRPAELGGPLGIRRSPSRDLPKNVMDIRIKPLPTDIPAEAAANADPNGHRRDRAQDRAGK